MAGQILNPGFQKKDMEIAFPLLTFDLMQVKRFYRSALSILGGFLSFFRKLHFLPGAENRLLKTFFRMLSSIDIYL